MAFPELSEFNAGILREYLMDMETGLNVSRKGALTYARLNNLRQRLNFIFRLMQKEM